MTLVSFLGDKIVVKVCNIPQLCGCMKKHVTYFKRVNFIVRESFLKKHTYFNI